MTEDPTTAGQPGQRGGTRTYERDGLAVEWDATLCIHTARCILAEPAVFDPQRRPWVDLSAADPAAVVLAVRACPTGALRYRSDDPALAEEPPSPTVEVRPDGPLFVRGDVRLEGAEEATGARFALCRCGATGNPPYCDNSHRAVGFRARDPQRRAPKDAVPGGPVTVTVPDQPGPYRVEGARVVAPSGDLLDDSGKCFLCRCGRSAAKPFCDGSHSSPGPDA